MKMNSELRLASVTTTQRDALSPQGGDVIWNSTLGTVQWYDGSTWNSTNGIRKTVTYTTASLANNARETGVVAMAKTFRVMKVVADRACRIRLYTSTTKRDNDATRRKGAKIIGDTGIILDLVLDAGTLTWHTAPMVEGANDDTVVVSNIPITITNESGSSHTVAVTFTYVPLEV